MSIPFATVISVGDVPSAPPGHAPAVEKMIGMQNDGGAREFLTSHNWPESLQDTFLGAVARAPLRFFICDDSGSMQTNDGRRIVKHGSGFKFADCSRWTELTTSLEFHADLAHKGLIPTEFRMLNAAQPLRIGFDSAESAENLATLKSILRENPNGGTPLCRHVNEVVYQIRTVEHELRSKGNKAVLVIATDGEASDGDIAQALLPLKDLPVWVMVRLCTNSDSVVEYWNALDNVLEHNLDILDDLASEAKEVHSANPWLTYNEQMHRFREFGVTIKELDMMDEGKLSKEHMRKVCKMFYGNQIDTLPDPDADIKGFVRGIHHLNASSPRVWDPITRTMKNYVESTALGRCYGGGGCTIM